MKKKVLVIGANGTIGRAIVANLKEDCDVIEASRSSPTHSIDLSSSQSIADLYGRFKDIDAVVCAAAADIAFKPLIEMTRADYLKSLQSKQLGQIDLVLQGLRYLKDHVSYTLTTGLLNFDPIATGTAAAMLNGAIEGFARAAAIDMPGRQRINVVTPALLEEAVEKYRDVLPGFPTASASLVADAYRKSIMTSQNGQVIKVGW